MTLTGFACVACAHWHPGQRCVCGCVTHQEPQIRGKPWIRAESSADWLHLGGGLYGFRGRPNWQGPLARPPEDGYGLE